PKQGAARTEEKPRRMGLPRFPDVGPKVRRAKRIPTVLRAKKAEKARTPKSETQERNQAEAPESEWDPADRPPSTARPRPAGTSTTWSQTPPTRPRPCQLLQLRF
ncbi:unnamed protein product, partial [Tetraodon nigroviridis]